MLLTCLSHASPASPQGSGPDAVAGSSRNLPLRGALARLLPAGGPDAASDDVIKVTHLCTIVNENKVAQNFFLIIPCLRK